MKNILKYDTEKFEIIQNVFKPGLTAKTESMMALGNGYLGLRSSDEEEETINKEDLLVNGVFNQADDKMVSELANLADLTKNKIFIGGKLFRIQNSDKYSKKLSIKNGYINRDIIAIRGKKTFELHFERIVSVKNRHLYAQRITIKQLAGKPTTILIQPRINGQTTNHGTQHLKEGEKRRPTDVSIQYFEETNESSIYIAHNMVIRPKINGKQIKPGSDDFILTMTRRKVGFDIKAQISPTKKFVMEKIMSVSTTIDEKSYSFNNLKADSTKLHNEMLDMSYDDILNESNKAWGDIFKQFDLSIIGNSDDAKYDRLALAFSIFHMHSFIPKDNPYLSVGAKGLSGEGYQGHSYWDTEFFIVPNYFFTKPKIARNLLQYRYLGISGARAKAKEMKKRQEESNLKGAQYPWEMAWPTRGEVSPHWGQADVVTGEQVPIASRRQEIHVSADIAFAVDQYFMLTNDKKFMNEMGYEIIIDTAIFWTNRAELLKNGTYSINDVMGPNEYKGNINNNAFTNAMAVKNIELALGYIKELNKTIKGKEILKKVTSKIPYDIPIRKMNNVAKRLKLQVPNKYGIIAENDTFLKLPLVDVAPFQLLGDAGRSLFYTKNGQKRLGSQLVKQADVVLLTYLMPEKFDKEIIKKNFEYYEPITTHDSSLSPTTYAIQAIELRKMELAYKLFKYSINIDLGPNMKSCDGGIHAGSIAAIWQTMTFGYGGLRYYDKNIHINPILPKQWDGMEYSIVYQGAHVNVKVNKKSFIIKTLDNKSIMIYVNSKKIKISNTPKKFWVQHEY